MSRFDYESPQEKEARRLQQVAQRQTGEQHLRDSTKKRETRYCRQCGMPFWAPPRSERIYCLDHDRVERGGRLWDR